MQFIGLIFAKVNRVLPNGRQKQTDTSTHAHAGRYLFLTIATNQWLIIALGNGATPIQHPTDHCPRQLDYTILVRKTKRCNAPNHTLCLHDSRLQKDIRL
jgi:hypothetical protein